MIDAGETRAVISDRVVGVLRGVAAPYDALITEATELYYDLGLSGDDLYEAINKLRKLFGTDFSRLDLRRYTPNETGHIFRVNLVRAFREWRGERTYRSLRVGSLIDAIQAGAWRDR